MGIIEEARSLQKHTTQSASDAMERQIAALESAGEGDSDSYRHILRGLIESARQNIKRKVKRNA